jgi:hypothetical protein
MNTLEDRVRGALRVHAETFSADPDAWARLQDRSRARRRRRGGPRWPALSRFLVPAAAAAAMVAIAVAAAAAGNVFGRAGSASSNGGAARPRSSSTAAPGAIESPFGPYSSSGPASEMLTEDPPVSAVISLPIPRAAGNANRAVGYFWIGYASPHIWLLDQVPSGPQFCNDTVNVTNGQSSGFCSPLPQLGAGHLASVTGNESVGTGQTILLGAAAPQVDSVAALLPDGRTYAGVVKTGRGFSDKAWTVGYPPAKGVRLVFRYASGEDWTMLGTAAPLGPPQVAQPRSGGITVFRYPAGRGERAGAVTAYLIEGHVGFWSLLWAGYIAPVPAANGPAADGLIMFFGPTASSANPKGLPKLTEAFGYAREDVARVVVHLPSGQAGTSTVAAWPGSGIRLWSVSVPTRFEYIGRTFTVTAYDAAGHVVQTDTLGQIG